MKNSQAGFSLVELVLFIVVIGFAVSALFLAFRTSLIQNPYVNAQTNANYLAQGRMSFILGQKRINGFSSFSDLCAGGSPPAICTLPAALSAYSVSSSISNLTISGDPNYKVIDVTVSGPQNAYANLKTLVAS